MHERHRTILKTVSKFKKSALSGLSDVYCVVNKSIWVTFQQGFRVVIEVLQSFVAIPLVLVTPFLGIWFRSSRSKLCQFILFQPVALTMVLRVIMRTYGAWTMNHGLRNKSRCRVWMDILATRIWVLKGIIAYTIEYSECAPHESHEQSIMNVGFWHVFTVLVIFGTWRL